MHENFLGSQIRRGRANAGKMAQTALAERADVSVDLIRKLEQGARHTASIASLQRIAGALDVTVGWLLDKPISLGPDASVLAIRRALTPVDDLIGDLAIDGEPLTLTEAARTTDYLWGAYWSGRYELLAQLLPNALQQIRATRRDVPDSDRAAAADILTRTYQVAGDTLVHLGQPDAAWLAAREALRTAEHGTDELVDAGTRVSISWQLLVQGRYAESEHVARVAADRIEPTNTAADDAHVAAYGILTVTAATAAARAARKSAATELLDTAGAMATRIGHDRTYHQTSFGPAKVAMLAVDVAVVQDEWVDALSAARRLPRDSALPLASRARHLADVALAQTRLGHHDKAIDTLLAMEHMAPEWIEHQSLPTQIVSELQVKVQPPRLRDLAKRLRAPSM